MPREHTKALLLSYNGLELILMFFYTVRPGDTLYSIAARFGVQIASILAVNPGLNPFNLYAGLAILIPARAFRPFRPPFPIFPRPPIFPPRDRDRDRDRFDGRPDGGPSRDGPGGRGNGGRFAR